MNDGVLVANIVNEPAAPSSKPTTKKQATKRSVLLTPKNDLKEVSASAQSCDGVPQ
jgi:hypothetical protein